MLEFIWEFMKFFMGFYVGLFCVTPFVPLVRAVLLSTRKG